MGKSARPATLSQVRHSVVTGSHQPATPRRHSSFNSSRSTLRYTVHHALKALLLPPIPFSLSLLGQSCRAPTYLIKLSLYWLLTLYTSLPSFYPQLALLLLATTWPLAL